LHRNSPQKGRGLSHPFHGAALSRMPDRFRRNRPIPRGRRAGPKKDRPRLLPIAAGREDSAKDRPIPSRYPL